MGSALDDLLDLLELESLEVNLFRGLSPDEDRQRVFGGQVAAQALIAAGRTVEPDRPVHSLHAYFLRPGDPTIPIVYEVDRIRDGHSFTTRRVVAIQHGRAIFNLQTSFQVVEGGPDHSFEMPDVPDPDELPTFRERIEGSLDRFGLAAIDAVHQHDYGKMVALQGTDIVRVPIDDAVRELKTVPSHLLEDAAVFFG